MPHGARVLRCSGAELSGCALIRENYCKKAVETGQREWLVVAVHACCMGSSAKEKPEHNASAHQDAAAHTVHEGRLPKVNASS
jgi:hypothetical protein